jgi:hypothetical protein
VAAAEVIHNSKCGGSRSCQDFLIVFDPKSIYGYRRGSHPALLVIAKSGNNNNVFAKSNLMKTHRVHINKPCVKFDADSWFVCVNWDPECVPSLGSA